jgi:hypothetical protein
LNNGEHNPSPISKISANFTTKVAVTPYEYGGEFFSTKTVEKSVNPAPTTDLSRPPKRTFLRRTRIDLNLQITNQRVTKHPLTRTGFQAPDKAAASVR